MCRPKAPKVRTPQPSFVPPPAAPKEPAELDFSKDEEGSTALQKKRGGKRQLRINRSTNTPTGGSGLKIPS